VTKPSQSDEGSEESGQSQWNPLTELRDWKAVTNNQLCHKIAKKLGKRLVKIEQTGNPDLPYACIFEEEETTNE
jgi:hypothetical protein